MAVKPAIQMNSEAAPGIVKATGNPSERVILSPSSGGQSTTDAVTGKANSQYQAIVNKLKKEYNKQLSTTGGKRKSILSEYEKSLSGIQGGGEQGIREKFISRGLGSSGALQQALNDYAANLNTQRTNLAKNRDTQLKGIFDQESTIKNKYNSGSAAAKAQRDAVIRRLNTVPSPTTGITKASSNSSLRGKSQ